MPEAALNGRAPGAARSAHGLRALWRGALPLRLVFWVLNVAVHAAVNAVLAALEWWGGQAYDEADAFRGPLDLFAVLVVVLYAVYAVIAWVGLWRSAGRYPGRRLWRGLARLAAIAGVVFTGAAIAGEVFSA